MAYKWRQLLNLRSPKNHEGEVFSVQQYIVFRVKMYYILQILENLNDSMYTLRLTEKHNRAAALVLS